MFGATLLQCRRLRESFRKPNTSIYLNVWEAFHRKQMPPSIHVRYRKGHVHWDEVVGGNQERRYRLLDRHGGEIRKDPCSTSHKPIVAIFASVLIESRTSKITRLTNCIPLGERPVHMHLLP